MAEQNQDKRTASQKIDDLERAIMGLYQTADNMARDLMVLKDAVKLLGNKLQSVVQILASGSAVTDESISQKMIENNVSELRDKVTALVTQGVLVATDTVTESSFLVGRELADDNSLVNPRLQFALAALGEELKTKLKDGKIGEVITLQEGKLKFELLEVYNIQSPKAPEDTPALEAVPTASEPEESQSSNNETATQ